MLTPALTEQQSLTSDERCETREQRDKAGQGKAAASSHSHSEWSFSENCKILKSARWEERDEAVSKRDQQAQFSEKYLILTVMSENVSNHCL